MIWHEMWRRHRRSLFRSFLLASIQRKTQLVPIQTPLVTSLLQNQWKSMHFTKVTRRAEVTKTPGFWKICKKMSNLPLHSFTFWAAHKNFAVLVFFLKLDHYWGTFWKINLFCPLKIIVRVNFLLPWFVSICFSCSINFSSSIFLSSQPRQSLHGNFPVYQHYNI